MDAIRVAAIDIELGMSVQGTDGIWRKPPVKMSLEINGATDPEHREQIIRNAFNEVCDKIEEAVANM